ncbi:MAG: hypothetical protein ACXWQO_07965 [Bdellovibrionota bacterium]
MNALTFLVLTATVAVISFNKLFGRTKPDPLSLEVKRHEVNRE